jgi:glycosyltransferase involved in cell wall biosynthesis
MENALLSMGAIPSKVARFPWGVDCELFAHGRRSEAEVIRSSLRIPFGVPVILSSRNMRPLYNIHLILRSVPVVLKQFPEAVFVFLKGYGLFPYEQQLRAVAEEMGLTNNVRFVYDLLSPEQMAVFLNASDIVISIPSSDSLPISVFEAMACDVVPIMSDIEANREVMARGSKGFLVPIDEQQLASTVIYCLENLDSLREAVSAHNKDYVLRYQNWKRSVEDMERVYHSCLENG